MSKHTDTVPEDKLALYLKLLDTHPEIERKGGQKLPYTSMNGHMFTQLTKAGVVGLRMSKADCAAFNEKYDAEPLMSYGAVMKEYVAVPDDLLENTEELAPYLAMSYAYVQTLKPKSRKK